MPIVAACVTYRSVSRPRSSVSAGGVCYHAAHALLSCSRRHRLHAGCFAGNARRCRGGRSGGAAPDPKEPVTVPQLLVACEHYNRIARLVEKKIPVTLALDVQNRFLDDARGPMK